MKALTKILLLCLIASIVSTESLANGWERLQNLRGKWKFSIGDDKNWAMQNFNDRGWDEIKVPSMWEDQGFYGYDGYAWYRKHFYCSREFSGKSIYLMLGFIDDADEVYLNGTLIGSSGSFPPCFNTAYNALRKYYVPEHLLKYNSDNVIAVRVYDAQLGGGIVSGDVGFYYQPYALQPDVVLEGIWKFRVGNNMHWKDKTLNEKDWGQIFVPGYWENQGYKDYNGFAWYRKKFVLPDYLKKKKLVLMMGKIDDIDEVYLNGQLIGATGQMQKNEKDIHFDQEYSRFRGYYIPDNLITNGENVIAVRVYDNYINGGIYEGPIGVISQDKYVRYWKGQRKSKSFWDYLWNN